MTSPATTERVRLKLHAGSRHKGSEAAVKKLIPLPVVLGVLLLAGHGPEAQNDPRVDRAISEYVFTGELKGITRAQLAGVREWVTTLGIRDYQTVRILDMPLIEKLALDTHYISDEGIKPLAQLKHLKNLSLSGAS